MAAPTDAAVRVQGLRKVYGSRVAVDSLDLAAPRGSFFGMVGPNGAGKTTTLRMITGLLRPDAGSAVVEGIDVWRDPLEAKRRIGVLPEDVALFDRLTGRQLLTYTGLLRGMPAATVAERTEQLLDVLGLTEAEGTLVVDYSHGMRKKVALAAALLHAPRVLFLDEPFEAVDPVSARTLRAVLEQHRANGGTVIFSSHVMELVERLCDTVAVLHAGRLVALGPLEQVRGKGSLEDAFVSLVGADDGAGQEGLRWLGSSSG
ncbi:MAG: ABC transporter ATP-binding protein [Actinomycetota bacterium]|nr:ABC transporter ATP-binding protein [Actinomycetota bacterium]